MVTITLHDKDAISVLALVQSYQKRQEEADPSLARAASAFKCALLICDCNKSTQPEPEAKKVDLQYPQGDMAHSRE